MAIASPWLENTESTGARPRTENEEVLRRRFGWWTLLFSLVNLAATIGLVYLEHELSESWWLSGIVLFLPQTPFLVPSICLMGCSLIWHMRSIFLNLISAGLVLYCLCDARVSMKPLNQVPDTSRDVRLVTCNVQNFQPDFNQLLDEIAEFKPDVVMLQEARTVPESLSDRLKDWNWQHDYGFLIGSKWPMEYVETCYASPYRRHTTMTVRIQSPAASLLVTDVHLMTARKGLAGVSAGSLIDGSARANVEHHAFLRAEETRETRLGISGLQPDIPHIIAGDFNMPTRSSIFRQNFSEYSNAFGEAGNGFGYTAPCRPMKFWLPGVPWLRIDHVLISHHWETIECRTGRTNGSDHRLVAAVLQLRSETASPP